MNEKAVINTRKLDDSALVDKDGKMIGLWFKSREEATDTSLIAGVMVLHQMKGRTIEDSDFQACSNGLSTAVEHDGGFALFFPSATSNVTLNDVLGNAALSQDSVEAEDAEAGKRHLRGVIRVFKAEIRQAEMHGDMGKAHALKNDLRKYEDQLNDLLTFSPVGQTPRTETERKGSYEDRKFKCPNPKCGRDMILDQNEYAQHVYTCPYCNSSGSTVPSC
jgi:hypothetical protein